LAVATADGAIEIVQVQKSGTTALSTLRMNTENKSDSKNHVACAITTLVSTSDVLVAGNDKGQIAVWNWRTMKHVATIAGNEMPITCATFVGPFCVVGDLSGQIRVVNTKTWKVEASVRAHVRSVCSVDARANELEFLSASEDSKVLQWRIQPNASDSASVNEIESMGQHHLTDVSITGACYAPSTKPTLICAVGFDMAFVHCIDISQ
jgi:WD40 repeat protein